MTTRTITDEEKLPASGPNRHVVWWVAAIVILAAFVGSPEAKAQIAGYDFTGQSSPATFAATSYSSNLDSDSTLSRGAGAGSSTGANSFRTVGFKNDGISVTNTDYFQFTLSASSGNVLSISGIGARFNGTSTYLPATTQFAYSTDGSSFTLLGNPVTVTAYNSVNNTTQVSYDFSSVAALQNLADTVNVTFRFYASGSTGTGGFGFFSAASGQDGLDVYGTVPEPATVLGGVLLVGALGWNQRRRLGGFAGLLRKARAA